ncbi:hypothetical protein TSOC_012428, partial [Tetrabaena socialis]
GRGRSGLQPPNALPEAACRTRGFRFTPAAERARQDEWLLDWVAENGITWKEAVPGFQAQFPTAVLGSQPRQRLSHIYHGRAKKHGRQAPQELTSLGFPPVLPLGWYTEDGTAYDAGGVARTLADAWRASQEAIAADRRKTGRRTPGEQLALGLGILPAGWCIVGDTVYDAEGAARGPAVAYDASQEAACRARGSHFTPAAERARQDEWLLDWVAEFGVNWKDAVPKFQAQFPTAVLGSQPNSRLSHMFHDRAQKH